MKLTITLHYNTQWGESLHLAFSPVANVHSVPTLPMHTDGEGRWFITVEGDYKPSAPYTFVVMENGNIKRTEWRHHTLPETLHGHIHISDRWVDRSELAPFYSSAFTRAIFAHDTHSVTPHGSAGICLCCEAPTLRKNQILAVCGDAKALGAWDTHHARIMEPHGTEWQLWLDKSELGENCEFKFIILEKSTDNGQQTTDNENPHPEANNYQLSIINYQFISWEPNDNRTLHIDPYSDVTLRVLRTYTLRDPQEPWRGAGVAIPVFSLRSKKSFGIGEFSDIPLMVDWAAKTGQCFLQLLPVNDTTMNRNWHESYPYNAITCFALNPMYIRLEEVGVLTDKEAMKEFRKQQKELNKLPQVDFDAVVIAKWDYLHRIFAQEGEQTLASPSYKRFFKDNESWLVPYAEFCCIRDSKNPKDTGLYLYIQYHLHKQLKHAADYAHKHGVVLKGDIPIGISRTSVEAWSNPGLFCLESQAGAPPDAFARDGQNWGFPTYNWQAMAAERYQWFARRFTKMADYFDAYRIDHILGFFRIWEIPCTTKSGLLGHFNPAMPLTTEEIAQWGITFYHERHATPYTPGDETDVLFVEDPYQPGTYHPRINGFDTESFKALPENERKAFYALHDHFFYHRHNDFWYREAMKKLPALIDATDMLVCGEDLGMIPACVPDVMNELRILSLEIQRMPKAFGCTFDNPAHYPYYSVCTTSTHDMSGIRGWWEEDPTLTQRYWSEMLHQRGKAPQECEAWICEAIVRQHLDSPAMLTILPLQDWMAMDEHLRYPDPTFERINVPANSNHYWRYRMHLTLEELLEAEDLNRLVGRLVKQSGR